MQMVRVVMRIGALELRCSAVIPRNLAASNKSVPRIINQVAAVRRSGCGVTSGSPASAALLRKMAPSQSCSNRSGRVGNRAWLGRVGKPIKPFLGTGEAVVHFCEQCLHFGQQLVSVLQHGVVPTL